MKTERAWVGARGVDSLPFSHGGTAAQACALKASGVDFLVGYLGAINSGRLGAVIDAGLAFMPVTFAGEYFDGPADEVSQLRALDIPPGCTVWLDLEGEKTAKHPAPDLIGKIDAWARAIAAAGYEPGLYIGSPQPLTAEELGRLAVVRYWKAPSRVVDRYGVATDTPMSKGQPLGFCMFQMWPQGMWKNTGVFVDSNIIGQDFRGRVPAWVVGSEA